MKRQPADALVAARIGVDLAFLRLMAADVPARLEPAELLSLPGAPRDAGRRWAEPD